MLNSLPVRMKGWQSKAGRDGTGRDEAGGWENLCNFNSVWWRQTFVLWLRSCHVIRFGVIYFANDSSAWNVCCLAVIQPSTHTSHIQTYLRTYQVRSCPRSFPLTCMFISGVFTPSSLSFLGAGVQTDIPSFRKYLNVIVSRIVCTCVCVCVCLRVIVCVFLLVYLFVWMSIFQTPAIWHVLLSYTFSSQVINYLLSYRPKAL